MHPSKRELTRDECGAALVEFALVAPVLILVLVGCLDLARGVNAYVTVENASREGARFATLHPTAKLEELKSAVRARLAPLDTSSPPLAVDVSYDNGSGVVSWPPTGGVPLSAGRPVTVSVRVVVSYQWAAVTSLVGLFFASSGATFTSSSEMDAIR